MVQTSSGVEINGDLIARNDGEVAMELVKLRTRRARASRLKLPIFWKRPGSGGSPRTEPRCTMSDASDTRYSTQKTTPPS